MWSFTASGEMTCVFCRWVRFRIVTYIGIILKHVYLNEECKQLYNTLGFCQRGAHHELELVTEVLIFCHVNLSYKKGKNIQMSVYMRLCYGLRLVFCLWGDDLSPKRPKTPFLRKPNKENCTSELHVSGLTHVCVFFGGWCAFLAADAGWPQRRTCQLSHHPPGGNGNADCWERLVCWEGWAASGTER